MGGLKPGTGSALVYRRACEGGRAVGSTAVLAGTGALARTTEWQIWQTVQPEQSAWAWPLA